MKYEGYSEINLCFAQMKKQKKHFIINESYLHIYIICRHNAIRIEALVVTRHNFLYALIKAQCRQTGISVNS